jgi:hypothetical protein
MPVASVDAIQVVQTVVAEMPLASNEPGVVGGVVSAAGGGPPMSVWICWAVRATR